jgi:hypothetical protein
VTTAALRALEAGNVNLVLPYAPAWAEPELNAAFVQAVAVRGLNPEARALADRYFMETAVRLHRACEGAPYEGLKPAGTDFGPVIPAAERALESGQLEPLLAILSDEMTRAVTERFKHALVAQGASKEPTSAAEVPAVRERISEELGFIGYVVGIYLAMKDGGHVEGTTAVKDCAHPPPDAAASASSGRRGRGRGMGWQTRTTTCQNAGHARAASRPSPQGSQSRERPDD